MTPKQELASIAIAQLEEGEDERLYNYLDELVEDSSTSHEVRLVAGTWRNMIQAGEEERVFEQALEMVG